MHRIGKDFPASSRAHHAPLAQFAHRTRGIQAGDVGSGGGKRAREDSNLRPAVSAIPLVSQRPGPSHHPAGHRVPGAPSIHRHACCPVLAEADVGRLVGTGVLVGHLTRWSLHLPSPTRACARSPGDGSARDYPSAPSGAGVGFPEFTRFASGRYRPGPLFDAEGNRRSILLSYERV